jgi:hypothetical protein
MTTAEMDAGKVESHDTVIGRLLWLVHGKLEQLEIKLGQWMAPRGPDPDDDGIQYRDRIPLDLVREILETRRAGNGSVDGGNWKAMAIVLGCFSVIVVMWLAWFSNTVIQTRQDVMVIKCQLDPKCRIMVPGDKS